MKRMESFLITARFISRQFCQDSNPTRPSRVSSQALSKIILINVCAYRFDSRPTIHRTFWVYPIYKMPAVQLTRKFESDNQASENPLPRLLQTPVGLVIVEIQGTVHAPNMDHSAIEDNSQDNGQAVSVGRLEFPNYDGSDSEGSWMKRVYLYIGKHQRLTGEIKKLAKPLVILSKNDTETHSVSGGQDDQLSIDAIIRHKILFSSRPEPVGT